MRNRNVWVILIAALLILAALVAAMVFPAQRYQFVESQDTALLSSSEENNAPHESADPTASAVTVMPSTPAVSSDATLSIPSATAAEIPTSVVSASPQVTVTAAPSTTGVSSSPPPNVKAYLLVTVRGLTYQPIPLYEEHDYTIRQQDGSENIIHVTEDSVCMKSSTCENQDCVQQGTVTVDNCKERILYNMILCLPNQVYLELYSPEDLAALLAQWAAEDAQPAQ